MRSHFVLASTSPRRKELLASTGLPFSVVSPPPVEPQPEAGENPQDFAVRAACAKGRAALASMQSKPAILLAADTIVSIDEKILGKPRSEEDAFRMLMSLNGRNHFVFSAIYLVFSGNNKTDEEWGAEKTEVTFADWSCETLKAYAHSGESLDKAGAYAMQGKGSFLVSCINGSWSNVVGLPMTLLLQFLVKRHCIVPGNDNRNVFQFA